jgi:uncharacterized protein
MKISLCLKTISLLAFLSLSAQAEPAQAQTGITAPSFNCAAARARIERVICASSDLSRQDREMARLYRQLQSMARADASDVNRHRTAQRNFIAQRNRCDGNPQHTPACLTNIYDDRIIALNQLIGAYSR